MIDLGDWEKWVCDHKNDLLECVYERFQSVIDITHSSQEYAIVIVLDEEHPNYSQDLDALQEESVWSLFGSLFDASRCPEPRLVIR